MEHQAAHQPEINWETAYVSLKPVFLAILHRLTSQGYVLSAGQGMDLIHDFFAEAWKGVADRYDPSRASLKVYAAVAFARFARPRLVREARWLQILGEELVEPEETRAEVGQQIDLTRVREALCKLPTTDHKILAARFSSDEVSERKLAREAGISRYKFRERLAEALARFAVSLGEAGSLSQIDFYVARLLFKEEQSVNEVSAELGLSAAQVRDARRRILLALGKASIEILT